ncbi:MAG: Translation initiation factor IF-3 [Parcubacteria group bacterium GW2011_GWB1_46_8]|nr:MAG: Translation initiation factor IF-3 [Parcubacteria group bacterium GW2011_GWF1_45_5]KKU45887.1 MAG: Translation initiation factor IF-3 [Parcubacteria group bacterium GW2011_GWB1_46_8]KKU47551.1 MAG: Translation initiation factor IF-3 [Parcubacteria group bacterium GW2011_GWF2_46_8]
MYQRTSYRPSRPQPPKFKINDFITAPTVRVLDDQGENLGVMPLIQARQIAKERGVDMVQIAQTPTEAVVKLIELGKFKYQQGKKEQKEKSHEKKTGSKIIRVGYLSQQHDLETKAKQADKFMADGYQVEISMMLRGRQKAHQDIAVKKLHSFLPLLATKHKVIRENKTPRGFIISISRA